MIREVREGKTRVYDDRLIFEFDDDIIYMNGVNIKYMTKGHGSTGLFIF